MTKKQKQDVIERSRPGSLGSLYDVLDTAFPAYRTRLGFLNVKELADDLDATPQALYKWFKQDKVPVKKVRKLTELGGKRLPMKALEPFIFD